MQVIVEGISDGHASGPANGYGKGPNASTPAAMSLKSIALDGSGILAVSCACALIGAVGDATTFSCSVGVSWFHLQANRMGRIDPQSTRAKTFQARIDAACPVLTQAVVVFVAEMQASRAGSRYGGATGPLWVPLERVLLQFGLTWAIRRRSVVIVAHLSQNGAMPPSDTTRMTFLMRLRDRSDTLTWEQFNERYGELLYRYARKRGASHNDAEDVVQEVIMSLFKAMEGFEYDARKGRFRGYLRTAVAHAMGRRAQKDAKQAKPLDPHAFDFIQAEKESSADARWEQEWRLHRLRWALRKVATEFEPVTLKAFELHALRGMTVDEAAQQLEISKASVYQAKSRVLRRVKEQLDTLDPDEDV